MNKKNKIRIGTRSSKLALWQANWIKKLINNINSKIIVNIIPIKTKGDKITDISLGEIGGKGLFINEVEELLIKDKIDLAVHSMKDMPAKISSELCIAAIPKREDPRDAILSKGNLSLMNLKKKAKIGTSSLRRTSQLLYWRPDLKIIPLRGNIETRIKKINTYKLDAVILASAGIKRLKYKNYVSRFLETDILLPAVGQGALCVEIKKKNSKLKKLISLIDNFESKCTVMAERSFLFYLEGGCHVPIAANAIFDKKKIILDGIIASNDGNKLLRSKVTGYSNKPKEIGEKLAKKLLLMGAKNIYKS